jgi:Stress responsive A/B Barrel Domain
MFHHLVLFYLRKDLTASQRADFESKLRGLSQIKSIHSSYVGRPTVADRPIIDSSYDFAEIFIFKNKADHDAYQVDPIHVDFVNSCKSYWSSVKIYDFE